MAAGEWISVSAQNELIHRELEIERREIAHNTQAETAELAGMYRADGMTDDAAARAAKDVMRRPDVALAVHARAELGVDPDRLASPARAAISSILAFLVGALLPVVPWFFPGGGTGATVASVLLAVVAAGFVGAGIGRLASRSIPRSAVRQMLIVIGGCAITYAIGKAVGVNV
jgi:VIT1/CCC1 family predicted Fe2+/Mn2+ transporter